MQSIISLNTGFHVNRPATVPTLTFSTSGGLLTTGEYIYAVSFITSIGETNVSDTVTGNATGSTASCTLTNIPVSGDIQVTGRKIYRTAVGATTLKYLATISNNSETSYVDGAADASLPTTGPIVLATSDQTIGTYGTTYFNGRVSCNASSATSATFTDTTCHGNFIKLTFTSVDTTAGNVTPAVITNNHVSANSLVTATIQSAGGTLLTDGTPILYVSAVADRSFTLTMANLHATAALTGTYTVYCSVIN